MSQESWVVSSNIRQVIPIQYTDNNGNIRSIRLSGKGQINSSVTTYALSEQLLNLQDREIVEIFPSSRGVN